jgi:hypothetical protein
MPHAGATFDPALTVVGDLFAFANYLLLVERNHMMFSNKFGAFVRSISLIAGALLVIFAGVNVLKYTGTAYGAPALQGGDALTTVPTYLNYQGTLRDPEGKLMSGLHDMTFRLYDRVSASLSEAVWVEVHEKVTVRDGQFSVLLGNNTPLPHTNFYGPDMFIGVTVAPFDEMVPRQRFASVPYAIYADHASSLTSPDGLHNTAVFVARDGKVGIGTTTPSAQLQIINTSGATDTIQIKAGDHNLAIDGNGIHSNAPLLLNTDSKAGVALGGNVGLGIASPEVSLHVKRDDADMILDSNTPDTGAASIRLREAGADKAVIELDLATDRLNIASQNQLAMTVAGANVGIGTTAPTRKLDVNGDAAVAGNLSFGSLSGFTISDVFYFEGNNGSNDFFEIMPEGANICFLSKSVVRNADDESEDVGCEVYRDIGRWWVRAHSRDDANAFCAATCMSWD